MPSYKRPAAHDRPIEAAVRHSLLRGVGQRTGPAVRPWAGRQSYELVAAGRAFRAALYLRGLRPSRLRAVGCRAGRTRSRRLRRRPRRADRPSGILRTCGWSRNRWAAGPCWTMRSPIRQARQGAGPELDIRHARPPRLRSVGRPQVRRLAQGRGSENRGGPGRRHPPRDGRRRRGAFTRPAPSLSRIDDMAGTLDKEKVRAGLRRAAPRTLADLADFRVPTLLVAGGEDVVFPPFLASAIAATLPCGEARMIHHAGTRHISSRPLRSTPMVEAFLARQR